MLSYAGMYSFRVDTYDHEIIEVKIPELVMSDKMTISAKVSEPEYMDMFAYVEYDGKTYSYQMEADENGVFNADISPIPACSKLNAYVGVYDEYGNITHSDKTCVFAVYEEDGKIVLRIIASNKKTVR